LTEKDATAHTTNFYTQLNLWQSLKSTTCHHCALYSATLRRHAVFLPCNTFTPAPYNELIMTKSRLITWFGKPVTEADFEELYRVELPRVYNFFRYRVGDGQLAEDLTSETFEKAWRNRVRYNRNLAAFSTWVFTIARRVAIDHYRKYRAEVPLNDFTHPTADESMEDLAQQQADFARLSNLLARLADRDRELVALKYGAGLTNRTIADLTGLTESNVGVILHRALQILRNEWEVHT
jgi:RNA polymerase sigma-70 factor (ECF subfamily)